MRTKLKILFTSDWHVDAMTAGLPRHVESSAYVDALVEACETESVDVVCFLGDAFDPGSMLEGMWSKFMIEAHNRLTRAAKMGSVFITGNHDVLDSSIPMSTLSPLVASVAVRGMAWGDRLAVVAEEPQSTLFEDVCILALPYASRPTIRSGRHEQVFDRELGNAMELKRHGDCARVVVIGHYSLPGIVPGSEEEMPRGREMEFPAAHLRALEPDLVVNGHYHARQTVRVDGVTVEVVGAPTRFTFGEADDGERGFLLAEV